MYHMSRLTKQDQEVMDEKMILIIQNSYETYGKDWVEEQRIIQKRNINKIIKEAHAILISMPESFYERVYDSYGTEAEQLWSDGKPVPELTPKEVTYYVYLCMCK
jgi:hypothetical protein